MALEAAFVVPHPPLIIPAVGHGDEAKIQATVDAYDVVAREVASIAPDTIIVTSPHATAYLDYFHISPGAGASGNMHQFRAMNTTLSCAYDTELVDYLTDLAGSEDFSAGTDGERDPSLDHATYIPLWFVNKFYTGYKVVRIGLSGMGPVEHYRFGELIRAAIEKLGRRAVFIASGDLSHKLTDDGPYGFAPEGPVFDDQITRALSEGDFLKLLSFSESFTNKAAECGLRSFQIMAGALDGLAVEPKLLSYEGPFGVGYGVASFRILGQDEKRHFAKQYINNAKDEYMRMRNEEDEYVSLARASVEHYVKTGVPLSMPAGLPDEMLNRAAGTFVSLHKHGRLRGCIGTIGPQEKCIAAEIINNGISACSADPRFDPVREDEIDQLEISVDVLGPTEEIASRDELDPQRYGVIVSSGFKRGLLLPMLDGVDTVDEQINIARQKAGIGAHEDYSLARFEVVRHEPGKGPTDSSQQS